MRCGRRRSRRSGRRCGCCASSPACSGPSCPRCAARWRCASRWTTWSPGRATPSRWTARCPRSCPRRAGLRIVNGRHPLLLAGSEPVVPFDLEMDSLGADPPHQRAEHRRQDGAPQGGRARLRDGAERDRSAGRRRLPAAGVRRLLRRHRRPPIHLRQSLHLQRARGDAAPHPGRCRRRPRWCCWTRWEAAPTRPKARRWRPRSSRRSPRAARSRSRPPTSVRSRTSRATRRAWSTPRFSSTPRRSRPRTGS